MPTTVGTVPVPGASLYYKRRGSGPLILWLPGGAADADACDGVADQLADAYSVVTYDRRGLSRSTLHDARYGATVETHGDDAYRLLAALTDQPAVVFGSSIGAVIALDLVARYPHAVQTLIAHEPPSGHLLTEPLRSEAERSQQEVEDAYRQEGASAAAQTFFAITRLQENEREPGVESPRTTDIQRANFEFFLRHDFGAVRRYQLRMGTLKAGPTRIVPAGGRASRAQWPYHCAAALADQLGVTLAEFPGGHSGYITHPSEFAATLRAATGTTKTI